MGKIFITIIAPLFIEGGIRLITFSLFLTIGFFVYMILEKPIERRNYESEGH
jgi:MFS-type transporter involved in bile tolerance (Atg22 family)